MSIPLIAALVIGGVVLVALFLWASFVSASPGEIKVISGPRGQRVLHGKTGWKVPLLERVDSMTASMISVDAQTTDFVPTNDYINVRVDAAVKVRIATDDPTLFRAATRNFLYKETREISEEVRDTLEGHLRAIIGQMRLTDIITDRAAFSERVQENAKLDLEEMGLEIVAFNIQNVMDQNGVIDNLGIDNTEQIRKTAAIAKANAQKEVAQATAVAEKEANDAQVASQLEIAQKQTDLAKRQAALKVEADTEKAKADAAYEIQSQIQRRDIERETAQADIVKQEQQAVIKEKEVVVARQALQAEVNAKADADRYAAEKKADAALYTRQRDAEAEAFERTKKADADKQAMLAEAQGIEARGRAEAAAIGAKLTAEAEGLEKKAVAMTKMNQAAVLEMYFRALPEVARAVAEPLANVDSITMYGEGNSAHMVGDITKSITQINAGLGDSLGLNLQQLFSALVGAKLVSPTIADAVEEGVRGAAEPQDPSPSACGGRPARRRPLRPARHCGSRARGPFSGLPQRQQCPRPSCGRRNASSARVPLTGVAGTGVSGLWAHSSAPPHSTAVKPVRTGAGSSTCSGTRVLALAALIVMNTRMNVSGSTTDPSSAVKV